MAVLVMLQVKTREADRAIGLLPWLPRLWGRLRHFERAEWCKKRAGHWGTAVAGSSALRVAVWRAFQDELAEQSVIPDLVHASLLWDVQGFYDSLSWELVLFKALALGFPAIYLALELQMHMSPRFLREEGFFSEAIQPSLSLIPGSTGAVDLGRCALYFICEDVARCPPPTPSLHTWVDDI
eukprot:5267669-Pyramimonas_sp.AAC.1